MRFLLHIFASFTSLASFVSFFPPSLKAAEPFLKPNDVIALVGGEDMVVASELGYLETLIQRALPKYHLKFRSLAWEGDTVFEQHRDLNYPTLEQQLDKIGATVVICQFGQMESLAGKEKLPEFEAAYEKLITRLTSRGKRRLTLVELGFPSIDPRKPPVAFPERADGEWGGALHALAKKLGTPLIRTRYQTSNVEGFGDGIHITIPGHARLAHLALEELSGKVFVPEWGEEWYRDETLRLTELRKLVVAKNRLWFNYYRPQNWAFLAGDRTNQPSSRDHKDPSKRWFPEELEKFVPLIEAKEQEIWALAEKVAAEGGAK